MSTNNEEVQTSILLGAANIPSDIIVSIFEQLIGDSHTLSNIGLTCRSFRDLSLPYLLRTVDLSSHNNGRIAEEDVDEDLLQTARECREPTPVVYADYYSWCRPDSLIPRQHAFLRLMLDRPELATYVHSFSWTILWEDLEKWETSIETESGETKISNFGSIEFSTWKVFSQLTNVTHLDLASLHEFIDDPYPRQNPQILFPAVTDLRLLGWMHRNLVSAILTSLNPTRLHRLNLDRLQDEGSAADGSPMANEFVTRYAPNYHFFPDPVYISDSLFAQQQAGGLFIFPGPMWFALRLLSTQTLPHLSHLCLKLTQPFAAAGDARNYHTMFRETGNIISHLRNCLETLKISIGEDPKYYRSPNTDYWIPAEWLRDGQRAEIRLYAFFLKEIALALSQGEYPRLRKLEFEGFRTIELADAEQSAGTQLQGLREIMDAARVNLAMLDVRFTEKSCLDYRFNVWNGYDGEGEDPLEWMEAMERSGAFW